MKLRSFKTIMVGVLSAAVILASTSARATDEEEGLAMMKGADCFTCHRVGQKLIGPAYKDVAAKYAGADDAKITELANKVIAGGSGNWGNVPMRAHPDITVDNAKKMVKWVLSQNAAAGAAAPAGAAPAAGTPAPAATTTTTTTTTTN